MDYSRAQLDEWHEVAVRVAKEAGVVALEASSRDKQVEEKDCSTDLVTETDKKVEELIVSSLKRTFPTHSFIGEESAAEGHSCVLTDHPTWIIDPIDGTTDFIHNFPFSTISIGLAVNKKSVVGVIYNFNLDQLFAAKEGGGATMNGKKINVSRCNDLGKALVMTEISSGRSRDIVQKKMDSMCSLATASTPIHGFRALGSAALDMCMVASGHADVYYQQGIHCWDIAAGDVIVREAGGVSMLPSGEPMNLMSRGMLCASTDGLAQQMVPHIRDIHYPSD